MGEKKNPLADCYEDLSSPLAKLAGGDGPIPVRILDSFEGAGGRFKGVPLAIRALSYDALQQAQADAIKHLVSINGFEREDLYGDLARGYLAGEAKVQVLSRALVDPEDPSHTLAKDANELRKLLEPDEIAALFEEFLDYQDERSPLAKARSWEDVEGFLLELGKGLTGPTSLASFDTSSLRFMLRSLAVRYAKLMTPACSSSSPASDTADESSR